MSYEATLLPAALDGLEALVDAGDRPTVQELRRRIEQQHLRLLVVGEAKRGKSTLINALLERPVLPTGVIPVTALPTTIAYGTDEHIEATFSDGRHTHLFLDELASLVSERANPANALGVDTVRCLVDAPLLAGGVELVDSPGVGSVHAHNTSAAHDALQGMDAAIVVVSADPPITELEVAWLREVNANAVRLFIVLNKADYLQRQELTEVVAFLEDVLSSELGHAPELFVVSARQALQAQKDHLCPDPSWRAFVASIATYVRADSTADLARSVTRRASSIVAGLLDQLSAAAAGLGLSGVQLDARRRFLAVELETSAADRRNAAAAVEYGVNRLVAETAELGKAAAAAALPAVREELAAFVAGRPGDLRLLETQALELAAERIRQVVDDWLVRHERYLGQELSNLQAELGRSVDQRIQRVRAAVSDLFDVQLAEVESADDLLGDIGFDRVLKPDAGQVDAFAATVRARLSFGHGRRRIAKYVDARAIDWMDRQMGRARSALTYQLREAGRQAVRQADGRYEVNAGRLIETIDRITELRRRDVLASAEEATRLAERRRRVQALAADLHHAANTTDVP